MRDATRFPRRLLPEALPANYGWSGNLKRDGDQAFIGLFHDLVNGWSTSATRLYPLHFISFPTHFGDHMIYDTSRGREGDVQALSVSIQAAPLIDPVQREAFRRFLHRPSRRVLSPLQGRSQTSPDRPNPGIYHRHPAQLQRAPLLEEQIREFLPAGTIWLPKDLTVRAQLHEGPGPLAASIPKRLIDMLVPINSA